MDDFERWASYYDIIYKSKYEDGNDYKFYSSLLSECDGKSLEIACGSGRIYLEAISDGFDVEGIDISERMLSVLQRKAKERGLEPIVYNQNVIDFSINKKYGLIYFPFSSITHVRGINNQRKAINNIFEHLEDGGKFALDLPVPSLDFADTHKQIRTEKTRYDGTDYIVEVWNEIEDVVNQQHIFHQRVINTNNREIEFRAQFELSLIPKEQLELLLIESGFSEYNFYDGFNMRRLSTDTDRLVVVATK